MDDAAGHETGATPEPAEQQAFIDKFRDILSQTDAPCITLTNVFKEMPITHPALLLDVRGGHVDLQTCALQLAAISQCREVYIQSPLVGPPVLGRLDSIVDIRHGIVRVRDFSYRELHVNSRSTVRVRFKKPISIVAYSGGNKVSGVIHDISLGGCCINTLVRHGLDETGSLRVELNLLDESTGRALSMQIDSSLVRVSGDVPPFRCALNFNHTKHSEQLLSIFINQRQIEILKELRESL